MEIRYIEWVDSLGSQEWEPLGEIRTYRPMAIISVGFVLDEGDDYVTILQSYDERSRGRPFGDHVTSIPKASISKAVTIREAE